MSIGKSYWAVSISNETVRTSMPNKEYRELQRTFRTKASSILNNRFEYKTQKEALAAQKKLPKEMQSWVQVRESFPVSLGLGWI
jgi:hypothetical protein